MSWFKKEEKEEKKEIKKRFDRYMWDKNSNLHISADEITESPTLEADIKRLEETFYKNCPLNFGDFENHRSDLVKLLNYTNVHPECYWNVLHLNGDTIKILTEIPLCDAGLVRNSNHTITYDEKLEIQDLLSFLIYLMIHDIGKAWYKEGESVWYVFGENNISENDRLNRLNKGEK